MTVNGERHGQNLGDREQGVRDGNGRYSGGREQGDTNYQGGNSGGGHGR